MNNPLLTYAFIGAITLTSVQNTRSSCMYEHVFVEGHFYVIGLYKMYIKYDNQEFDENAIRFHLKLR